MKIDLDQRLEFPQWRQIINPECNFLIIEKSGLKNYEQFRKYFDYYEQEYAFPQKGTFGYWPIIKINSFGSYYKSKNQQLIKSIPISELSREEIQQKRYTEAIESKTIERAVTFDEFVKNPKKRIYPHLPEKETQLIIFDVCLESGRTLDNCTSDLLNLGFDISKLFFSCGNYNPIIWTLKQDKN